MSDPLIVIPEITILSGQHEAYDAARLQLIAAAEQEEGILGYELFKDADDVTLIERYASSEAILAYVAAITATQPDLGSLRRNRETCVLGTVTDELGQLGKAMGIEAYEPFAGFYHDFAPTPDELSVLVKVLIMPGSGDAFREVAEAIVASTLEDEGALVYSWFINGDDVRVFERYANLEALQTHMKLAGPHLPAIGELVAAPSQTVIFGALNEEVAGSYSSRGIRVMHRFGGFRHS